jgi:hypothetical protein
VAGRAWELTTNSPALMASAVHAFPERVATFASEPSLRLNITATDVAGTAAWKSPKCRGRDHLVFSCVGENSALVYDYRHSRVVGRVSQAIAADAEYWREIIFPFALGVMSPMLATVPLHAAGFVHNGRGVIIGGRSGAGKSTLSATLARRGVTYVSDDWVYLTAEPELSVHSLPVPLKLLPDSTKFFPELPSMTAAPAENGEISVPIDPAAVFGARRSFACRPDVVILYDRVPGSPLRVRQASVKDLVDWFSESLDCVPRCLDARREEQLALIRRLQECTCYLVVTDGSPDKIADDILQVCNGLIQPEPVIVGPDVSGIEHLDLLRRGAPARYLTTVSIAGRAVQLATNHRDLLHRFEACREVSRPWSLTVIVERTPWASSDSYAWRSGTIGLRSLGIHGAIACDFDQREAVAFVSAAAIENGEFLNELNAILEPQEVSAGVGR